MANVFDIFRRIFNNSNGNTEENLYAGKYSDLLRSLRKLEKEEVHCNTTRFEEVKKRTGLNEYELWSLGLCGVLTQTGNVADHYVLNFNEDKEHLVKRYKESFKEGWGISNRQDLIRVLNWLEFEGHSESYNKYRATSDGPFDGETMKKIQSNQEWKNDYDVVTVTKEYVRDRSLIAWDYGRAINLCRRGYLFGYFTEEEAWNNIFRFTEKVKNNYDSWMDFGINFLIGRVYWADDKIKISKETVKLIKELTSEGGAWTVVPWI